MDVGTRGMFLTSLEGLNARRGLGEKVGVVMTGMRLESWVKVTMSGSAGEKDIGPLMAPTEKLIAAAL